MNTEQEYLDAIEAYFAPRIAQRQVAYDKYNQLTQKRDELVIRCTEHFNKVREIERLNNELGDLPGISE